MSSTPPKRRSKVAERMMIGHLGTKFAQFGCHLRSEFSRAEMVVKHRDLAFEQMDFRLLNRGRGHRLITMFAQDLRAQDQIIGVVIEQQHAHQRALRRSIPQGGVLNRHDRCELSEPRGFDAQSAEALYSFVRSPRAAKASSVILAWFPAIG